MHCMVAVRILCCYQYGDCVAIFIMIIMMMMMIMMIIMIMSDW